MTVRPALRSGPLTTAVVGLAPRCLRRLGRLWRFRLDPAEIRQDASWRGRRDCLRLHLSLSWGRAVVGFYQVDRDPCLCIADVKDDALGRLKLDVIRLKTVLVELHFEGLWRRIWRTADHRVGNPQLRLSVVDFVGYRIATRPEQRRCKNIAVAKLPAVKHRRLVGCSWRL